MKIFPLGTDVFHANEWQNEANSCDQHHTKVRTPVPIVRTLGGPQGQSR